MTRTKRGQRSRTRRRCAACLGALLIPVFLMLAGCGNSERRFDLSGTVAYGGQPVPAGYMILKPDESAGNKGPSSAVDIQNGQYATRPGNGVVGGPYVVNIFGYDGQAYSIDGMSIPLGKPVFTATLKADLPKQNGSYDFTPQAESAPR